MNTTRTPQKLRPSTQREIEMLAASGDISPAARRYNGSEYRKPDRMQRDTYHCPECNKSEHAAECLIDHRRTVQCSGGHVITVRGNTMFVWSQRDPGPSPAPRNLREQIMVASKARDSQRVLVLSEREIELRARTPLNPRREYAPGDAGTVNLREFIVDDEEETFRCPRCLDRTITLFHGEPKECPGGHMIELSGTAISTWRTEKPGTIPRRLISKALKLLKSA